MTILVFLILFYHDFKKGFLNVDWDGIWIEAHGMWFDIIILGLFLAIYDHFRDAKEDRLRKEDEIFLLKEELQNIHRWKEIEANHVRARIIRKLNKLNVTKIIFSQGCLLDNIDLDKANFEGSTLIQAKFNLSNLKETVFRSTNLGQSDFEKTYIEETIFEKANLNDSKFTKCLINKAKFQGATLYGAKFEEAKFNKTNLEGCKLILRDENNIIPPICADFTNATFVETTAFEFQRHDLIDCNADVTRIIFLQNPSQREIEQYIM